MKKTLFSSIILSLIISHTAIANSNAPSSAGGVISSGGYATGGNVSSGSKLTQFGTVVSDSDLQARVPGRPKSIDGSKVKTTSQQLNIDPTHMNGNVTTVSTRGVTQNTGIQDSTTLSGESSFGRITSHKVEDFQTTITRTKTADPSQLYNCPQGYSYSVALGCYLATPACPGSPIAKVWNSGTRTCDCPVASPNWNGVSCLAPCLSGQTFDGVSCVVVSGPTCYPTSVQQTVGCDAGFTGNKKQQRDYTCPLGNWTNWYDIDTSSCVPVGGPACTPQTQTQTVACDTGYTGLKQQSRTLSCPANTWSVWTDSSTSGCIAKQSNTAQGCGPNSTQQNGYTDPITGINYTGSMCVCDTGYIVQYSDLNMPSPPAHAYAPGAMTNSYGVLSASTCVIPTTFSLSPCFSTCTALTAWMPESLVGTFNDCIANCPSSNTVCVTGITYINGDNGMLGWSAGRTIEKHNYIGTCEAGCTAFESGVLLTTTPDLVNSHTNCVASCTAGACTPEESNWEIISQVPTTGTYANP